MPSFTFRSTVIPEDGPENNGITYGSGDKTNLMADFFSPALPVDPNLGRLPEVLRQHPHTVRSSHPILSFCSIHADEIVNSQTLEDPLSPLENLYRLNGQVLLLGCGQSSNFSVHLGEKHAGRKGFIRWAITPAAVVECSGIPGCPDGFEELDLALQDEIHRVQIGTFEARSMRIITLVDLVEQLVRENPLALLCSRTECERCSAIRNSLEQGPNP
jgi:aminoglycoside 3-N-acetyltransferase